MKADLRAVLERPPVALAKITEQTRQIYERLLSASPFLEQGNFVRIHASDLEKLFQLYDEMFFNQRLSAAVGPGRLTFRVAPRLTKSGGKTTRTVALRGDRTPHYEIAVSSHLLFQSFREEGRPVRVTGIVCHDRLEAMQRIFEHELIHLAENVIWEASNCAAAQFQAIAHRMFAHTEHRHRLITTNERAWREQGIRCGSRVRFQFDGVEREGVVNRITKRATVLVEDSRGQPYSDGKRYIKWYVPLSMLQLVST